MDLLFGRKVNSKAENNFAGTDRILTIPYISLNRNSVAKILVVLTSLLILASTAALLTDYLIGNTSNLVRKLVKFFYVDLELNAPTFFSTLLLLFAALLLGFISVLKRKQNAKYAWQWAILCFGFLLMAFDETVAAHERLIEPMRSILGEENLGILYYAWVVPAIALVLFLAIFFLKFWLSLPAKTRLYFLIAACLYVGAAIGLELAEGKHSEIYGMDNLTYITLVTIEEGLEMGSVILFIWALLKYIADTYEEVGLRFDASKGDL